jgi:cell division transport system permease protein
VRCADRARRVIPHAEWFRPAARLIRSLRLGRRRFVLLMTFRQRRRQNIMTARAALGTHYARSRCLHLIGATDRQITRLFQRRIAIDTAWRHRARTVAAAIMLLIGWQWSG